MDEKEKYQEVAKNTLKRVSDEKLAAVKEAKEIEKHLSATEDELAVLRELYEREAEDNKKLTEKIDQLSTELFESRKMVQNFQETMSKVHDESSKGLNASFSSPTDEDKCDPDNSQVMKGEGPEVLALLKEKCLQLETENKRLSSQTTIQERNDTSFEASTETNTSFVAEEKEDDSKNIDMNNSSQIEELSLTLEKVENEKQILEKEMEQLRSIEISRSSSSQDSEEKIVQLLKYKEKCAQISQEKEQLEINLFQLESEVETLAVQNQAATACSIIPLGILLISFIIAYLPFLSSLFGTSDEFSS